jgi:hypothetical protein
MVVAAAVPKPLRPLFACLCHFLAAESDRAAIPADREGCFKQWADGCGWESGRMTGRTLKYLPGLGQTANKLLSVCLPRIGLGRAPAILG